MLTQTFPETGLTKICLFQLIQQLCLSLLTAKIHIHINQVCLELDILSALEGVEDEFACQAEFLKLLLL